VPVEVRGEDVMMRFGDREYRVRGLQKNTSTELLKVNLRILGVNVHGDMALHVDTLELNAARQRMAFVKQAAAELGIREEIIRHDVGQVLFKLEDLRDEQIKQALAPKEPEAKLTDEERSEALGLLRDPRLLDRIVEDFARCGVVGEETNKLVGYLGVGVASSRLAAGCDRAVVLRRWQKLSHGCCLGLRAGRAAGTILRNDGAIALLHGRDRLQHKVLPSWRRRARSARPTP